MGFHNEEERLERIGYSLKECTELLPLSVAFLRKEAREGRLQITKFGDRAVVLMDDLNDYVKRQQERIVRNEEEE